MVWYNEQKNNNDKQFERGINDVEKLLPIFAGQKKNPLLKNQDGILFKHEKKLDYSIYFLTLFKNSPQICTNFL